VGNVQCPVVSREDIINACGVDEVHDGVNYTRTACVIAVARARETFEPYVHQLGFRLAHIARRLLPVAMYLLQKEGRILTGHEVGPTHQRSPHHPPHTAPVIATSSTTSCIGARHAIHHIVYRCLPRHPPHCVPVLDTSSTTLCTGACQLI